VECEVGSYLISEPCPRPVLSLTELLLTVVAVSATGALAPGPLFFYSVAEGSLKGARAGIHASVGHMVVEFPYVIAIALGLQIVVGGGAARLWASLIGGSALLALGLIQLLSLRGGWAKNRASPAVWVGRNAVLMGAILTGLNPFFLLWWVTVGLKLVTDALVIASLVGVIVMYLAHIWMDYAFLGLSAHLSRRGVSLLGSKGYKAIFAVFSLVLIYFGVLFITSALAI
jgi:threonine/homoserine/homoserine lactone efflux protein